MVDLWIKHILKKWKVHWLIYLSIKSFF